MIPVYCGRQLLPGSFEHALIYFIDNAIDLWRFSVCQEQYRRITL
jgi:hypothetical protein